jgi:penicillin amidase
VKIVQVNHGIKLVEAETLMGAIYGLGFVHAKDRLWQLDFYRYLVSGRLAELLGSEAVSVDRYVRTIGLTRSAAKFIEGMSEEERVVVQNYCNGVNKAAKNIKIYPAEYYILMTHFEEFTPIDAAGLKAMLQLFLTRDWALEYIRARLTEIYDRQLVDQLLPYQPEHYFDLGNMHTISDEDMQKFGFHEEDNHKNLFSIDDSLLHVNRGPKKDKLEIPFDAKNSHPFKPYVSSWDALGSNCWAIHGNFTKSGKPMLSCDPHLGKFTSATWYPARISWNETVVVDTEAGPSVNSYRTYIAGHSIVGIPFFSYIRTPYLAGGVTSLNPDF